MKLAYIAGPFRANLPLDVERNVRRAEELAYAVAEKFKIMPLCPHTNNRFFDKTLTDDFWLEGTTELMLRCDLVVLVFRTAPLVSAGTRAEVKRAREVGIPVYWYDALEDCLCIYDDEIPQIDTE